MGVVAAYYLDGISRGVRYAFEGEYVILYLEQRYSG